MTTRSGGAARSMAALRGDDAAVEHLATALWPRAWRIATSVLVDSDGTAEVTRDALERAFRHVGGCTDEAAFRRWADQTVASRAVALRRRWAPGRPGCRPVTPSASDPPDRALWEACRRLPPYLGAVVCLHMWMDMPLEEVASCLGIRPRAARTRYRRGLTRLRRDLGSTGGEVEERLRRMGTRLPPPPPGSEGVAATAASLGVAAARLGVVGRPRAPRRRRWLAVLATLLAIAAAAAGVAARPTSPTTVLRNGEPVPGLAPGAAGQSSSVTGATR